MQVTIKLIFLTSFILD